MSTDSLDPKADQKYLRNVLKDELDVVNIYIKACRHREDNKEELSALQSFKRKVKAALKSLAAGMG